jgi:hypothetical protein
MIAIVNVKDLDSWESDHKYSGYRDILFQTL